MMSKHTRQVLTDVGSLAAVSGAAVGVVGAAIASPVVAIVGTVVVGVGGVAAAIGTQLEGGKQSKPASQTLSTQAQR